MDSGPEPCLEQQPFVGLNPCPVPYPVPGLKSDIKPHQEQVQTQAKTQVWSLIQNHFPFQVNN